MSCDLCRLRTAIDTARDNADEERRFRMRLQGFDVPDPIPPDQSDDELTESVRNAMALFMGAGGRADDDD